MKSFINQAVAVASLAFVATSINAQDRIAPTDIVKTKKLVSGWDKALRVTGNANLSNNSSVIGKVDGTTTNFGFSIDSGAFYFEGSHEWRNTFVYTLAMSRDPVLKEYTKPTDKFVFDSIYLYHLASYDWVGPFARFGFEGPLFKSFDVQSSSKTYSITRSTGTITSTGKSLDLTDPLKPLTVKESVGAFVHPYTSKLATFEFRGGLGARQTFAKNQLILGDNAATADIEVTELRNSHQVGAELYGEVAGALSETVTYKVTAEALAPFYSNKASSDRRGLMDLTTYDFGTKIDAKLATWASVSHEFKALKQPLLLDKFQYTNSLLLNVGWDIFTRINK